MMRLALPLALTLCCGCAARGELRAEADQSGIRAEYVEQWRVALIDAARLIYAGDVERGRENVIGVTRSMYATTQLFPDAQAPSISQPVAAVEKPATEDNADVRGVLKKAQAAIAEMER